MDYAGIALLIGAIASFIEERYGKFGEMGADKKQAVNAVITYFIPLAVTLAATYIDPRYSGADKNAIAGLVLVAAPVTCWSASQLAHYIDKRFFIK